MNNQWDFEKLKELFDGNIKPWLMIMAEELARLVVAMLAVFALNFLLYTGAKAAWSLYVETNVGGYFQQHYPDLTLLLHEVFAKPAMDFIWQVTWYSLLYVLPFALLMHFFHVRHYIYANVPAFVKVIWFLGLTALVAESMLSWVDLPSWGVAYAVTLPSVACFLPVCLTLASHTIPDLITVAVRSMEWASDRFSR